MPGVTMGVEEAEPVASAQVQLVPGARDHQPSGGHRLGNAIVGLQVLAEDHSGAGDQPARIDQVARPALMHHDLRVRQMPQEGPGAAGVVQVDVRDDDVGDVARRDAQVGQRLQPDGDAPAGARFHDRGPGRRDQISRGHGGKALLQ